jgi:hypothetical protein
MVFSFASLALRGEIATLLSLVLGSGQNSRFLDFPIREKPHERFIAQITHLNPITPRIPKVAAKVRMELELVLLRQLPADFLDLFRVTDHQPEVFRAIRLQFLNFENRHELMLAQFAPRRSFATSQHFQAKHIRVKLHGFFRISDFDYDMVAAVDLNSH